MNCACWPVLLHIRHISAVARSEKGYSYRRAELANFWSLLHSTLRSERASQNQAQPTSSAFQAYLSFNFSLETNSSTKIERQASNKHIGWGPEHYLCLYISNKLDGVRLLVSSNWRRLLVAVLRRNDILMHMELTRLMNLSRLRYSGWTNLFQKNSR